MKNDLVGIIILLCVSIVLATMDIESEEIRRKNCLDSDNNHRSSAAKLLHIANMNKLEYDVEMEKVKPKEGFKCPEDDKMAKDTTVYNKGHWAVKPNSEGTAVHVIATKLACIQHKECGELLIVNADGNGVDRELGDAGTKCKGKVEDGLCVETGASNKLGSATSNEHIKPATANENTEPEASIGSVGSTPIEGLILVLVSFFYI